MDGEFILESNNYQLVSVQMWPEWIRVEADKSSH